jgi:hypothetical protein
VKLNGIFECNFLPENAHRTLSLAGLSSVFSLVVWGQGLGLGLGLALPNFPACPALGGGVIQRKQAGRQACRQAGRQAGRQAIAKRECIGGEKGVRGERACVVRGEGMRGEGRGHAW